MRPLGAIGESGCFAATGSQVNSEIYVALLNKTQELSISHAGTGGNVHIIDMALVSSQPAQAKTTLLIAAGGLLEVIACGVYAFVRRAFFAGADDPHLVERRFNLPIFGAIAFSGEQASWIVRLRCPQPRASSGWVHSRRAMDSVRRLVFLRKHPWKWRFRTRPFCRLHAVPRSLCFEERIRSIHRSKGFASSSMYENCTLWTLTRSRFENVFFASSLLRLLVAEPRSMAESSNPALTSTAKPRTWQPAINPDHYARNRQHRNPSTGADE
jgi:G-rich domain on putative tyrosine kinase